MANTQATWSVSLDCECPNCTEYVDILENPDFWDGRHLEVAEHMTERSRNMEVICPKCGEEFKVDCNY